jgi:LysM repeat protein
LCLVLEHTDCATYQAALAAHRLATPAGSSTAAGDELRGEPMTEPQATPEVDRVTRWAITRSTPVVLDHGRLPPAVTMLSPFRRGGQLALGSLLVVALSAVLGARLGAPPDGVPAGAVVSPSASASTTAASTPTPTVRVTPRPSPPASASVGPSVTAPVTPSPAPTASPVTYTVRSGDTLVRIASQFGTTAAAIATANGITDPGRISVGQVLVIPVPSS